MTVNRFEEYKARMETHYPTAKETAIKAAAKRGLSSIMNDTKWLELQQAVETLPFPPAYIEKMITAEAPYGNVEDTSVPTSYGDWSSFWDEGLPPFIFIEWLEVYPQYGKYRGRLIAREIIDETKEFTAILDHLSIPYEEDNGVITIYGYK